jgi:hypothetical protein
VTLFSAADGKLELRFLAKFPYFERFMLIKQNVQRARIGFTREYEILRNSDEDL